MLDKPFSYLFISENYSMPLSITQIVFLKKCCMCDFAVLLMDIIVLVLILFWLYIISIALFAWIFLYSLPSLENLASLYLYHLQIPKKSLMIWLSTDRNIKKIGIISSLLGNRPLCHLLDTRGFVHSSDVTTIKKVLIQ